MKRAALEAIWQEHRRWIAAVLLAHKPSWEDLDDLLQEVAMTLVRKGDTIRDENNIPAWLRTVAINAARASARSGKHRRTVVELDADNERRTDIAGSTCSEHPGENSREATSRTLMYLDRLPEAYREPLMLRALQGMSSRAIGEILKISDATVDTRVARARSMLRTMLEQEASEDQASMRIAKIRDASRNHVSVQGNSA